ncbi:MAG: LytR C-terminal domain-containing protein, partial [Mycolicibacterium aromaticivorans]|nr:LytR C-terminal domain-containing protein [Mycolicibacterium aromaticivorans]
SDTSGLASQAASLLGKHEFTISEVRDRESGEPIDTVITYGAGAQTDAQSVATLLGVDNAPQATGSVAADHIRVVLGQGYDLPLEQPQTEDSVATSTTHSWSEMTITPTPDQGAPIDGGKVPCVN